MRGALTFATFIRSSAVRSFLPSFARGATVTSSLARSVAVRTIRNRSGRTKRSVFIADSSKGSLGGGTTSTDYADFTELRKDEGGSICFSANPELLLVKQMSNF